MTTETTNPRLNQMREGLEQERDTIAAELERLVENRGTINEAIKVKRAELADVESAIKKLTPKKRKPKTEVEPDELPAEEEAEEEAEETPLETGL